MWDKNVVLPTTSEHKDKMPVCFIYWAWASYCYHQTGLNAMFTKSLPCNGSARICCLILSTQSKQAFLKVSNSSSNLKNEKNSSGYISENDFSPPLLHSGAFSAALPPTFFWQSETTLLKNRAWCIKCITQSPTQAVSHELQQGLRRCQVQNQMRRHQLFRNHRGWPSSGKHSRA